MLEVFSGKSGHPLADMKSALQVLGEIPRNDVLKAVQELSDWIDSINRHEEDFRLEQKYAVLKLFDEAAQPLVRKMVGEYFSPQALSKFQENRLWGMLEHFYAQTEMAYHDILLRVAKDERGAAAIKPEFALLCARGLAAIGGQLRMSAARYALVEHALWRRMADFYRAAEKAGCSQALLSIYTGYPDATSVQQEFVVTSSWYGLSAGSEQPVHGFILERLIAHLGKHIKVTNQFAGNAGWYFDLSHAGAPARANLDATIHPAMRFMGMADALPVLGELLKVLEKGVVPDELNFFGQRFEAGVVRDVARKLLDTLSKPMPTRGAARRKIGAQLQVSSGYANMLVKSSAAGSDYSVDTDELWEIEDISATGFRCVLPLVQAAHVKIGMVLASRPENVPQWSAGIVRRLFRGEDDKLHIGVEMLSTQIVGVSLLRQGAASTDEMQSALFLKRPNDNSGEAWLLLRPHLYLDQVSLNMMVKGKQYLLLPQRVVESGEDYELARYRLMQQEFAGES